MVLYLLMAKQTSYYIQDQMFMEDMQKNQKILNIGGILVCYIQEILLLKKMDIITWESWFEFSSPLNIQIVLPKFTYDFKDLLNEPLIELGLGVAFGGGADFSNITPGASLYISRVIHQTFIDVQEEGTEAAAATIVELRETSAIIPTQFIANKPFLYVIKENSTSAILFMGKVGRPQYD